MYSQQPDSRVDSHRRCGKRHPTVKNQASERAAYRKAANTLICPYCMKVRARDNFHQFKPRLKCKPCFTARQARFNESLNRAKQ